jgi:hypothetical protein
MSGRTYGARAAVVRRFVKGAAGVLGWVELHGGAPPGDFGTFLGAMALSLLAAALWSAVDAWRAPRRRVFLRWLATAVVVGGGLAVAPTLAELDGAPSWGWVSEVVSLALFFSVPLLVAAVAGVGLGGGAQHQPGRSSKATAGTGVGQ